MEDQTLTGSLPGPARGAGKNLVEQRVPKWVQEEGRSRHSVAERVTRLGSEAASGGWVGATFADLSLRDQKGEAKGLR